MSLPAASGFPQQSGVLIPNVWSGKMLIEYYAATCLSQITNTDYEGEIKNQGDKVTIRTLPEIDISDYIKGQDLVYQAPEEGVIELLIDKGKVWAYYVDIVDKHQADIDFVSKRSEHAALLVVRNVERAFFQTVISDAAVTNLGNTAGAISASIRLGALGATANHVGLTNGASGSANKRNILDFIVDAGTVLDEADVPRDENRWMTLPSFATGLMKTSDLKDASITGDNESPLRNGRHGKVDGMTIYGSNLLYSVVDAGYVVTYALFGHISAMTWAAQFTKNEDGKSEKRFGFYYRGLNVYGHKTLKPEGLGRAIIRRTIGADT